MSKTLLLGNEAVARGLYEAGVTVLSSYPGTPSTEITKPPTVRRNLLGMGAQREGGL